jgi:hypothetical protein
MHVQLLATVFVGIIGTVVGIVSRAEAEVQPPRPRLHVNADYLADPAAIRFVEGTSSNEPKPASCCAETCFCDEACCDCSPCCPTMCPCYYGYVEGLIFFRENGADNQPLVLDQNTGDVLLSVGDLDFGVAGGVRAVVGKQLDCGYTLEVGYFGLFDQIASGGVTGNNDLQIPGDLGLVVNNFFGADIVDVNYSSSIHSVEANLLCCDYWCGRRDGSSICREWAPFVGFRYLNFREHFNLSSTDLQESTTDYDITTHNNLIGAQLGGRYRVGRGRWSWEAIGKAGIFGNAAEQSAPAIIDFLDVVRRPTRSETGGSVAFVGEINLTGIYHFNEVWGLRAGYNLLWLEGVALAPDQLDFTNTPDSGTDLDTSGGVFLHGVSVGLEARW